MENVHLSETPDIVVAANLRSQAMRLRETNRNPIVKITVSDLRKFFNKIGFKGQRKKTKFYICNAIMEGKATVAWKDGLSRRRLKRRL